MQNYIISKLNIDHLYIHHIWSALFRYRAESFFRKRSQAKMIETGKRHHNTI